MITMANVTPLSASFVPGSSNTAATDAQHQRSAKVSGTKKMPSLVGGKGGVSGQVGGECDAVEAEDNSVSPETNSGDNAEVGPRPKSLFDNITDGVINDQFETMEEYCLRIGLLGPKAAGGRLRPSFIGENEYPRPPRHGMMGHYPRATPYATYGSAGFEAVAAPYYWNQSYPQAHSMNPAVMESYYGDGVGSYGNFTPWLDETGSDNIGDSSMDEGALDPDNQVASVDASDASFGLNRSSGNPPSLFAKPIKVPKVEHWPHAANAYKLTDHVAAMDQELSAGLGDVDPLADSYDTPIYVPGMAKGKKPPAGVRPKSLISIMAGREEKFRLNMNQELIEQQWPGGQFGVSGNEVNVNMTAGENSRELKTLIKDYPGPETGGRPAPLFGGGGYASTQQQQTYPDTFQQMPPYHSAGGGQFQSSAEYHDFANDEYARDQNMRQF